MFLKGFVGWRHPSELQNELLETLEAGLGAGEVTLATLRGSWMLGWRSCEESDAYGWLAGRPKAESTRPGGGFELIGA